MEMQDSSAAVDGDNNGFVNIPLAAKDIVAVVYMREVGANQYRASLRSKGELNVAKVAEKFGGGGHKNASGLSIEGDWDEMEREIVAELQLAIKKTT
jgi:bifunctional oligoribonuclease and PAP phosphatase NrnA